MKVRISLDDMKESGRTNIFPGRIYVTDLKHRSFFCSMQWEEGLLNLDSPGREPIAVHVLFDVPHFGTIWTTMDNCGEGYSVSNKGYSLMDELVNSRITGVERSLESESCDKASTYLKKAKDELTGGNKKEALRWSTLAGEESEFDRSKRLLQSASYRTKASFGSTFAGERLGDLAIGVGKDWKNGTPPPDFLIERQRWDIMAQLMNTATLPNFWRWIEPRRGKYNFDPLDRIVDFCRSHSIGIKTFALWWGGIGGTPKWLRLLDFKHQLSAMKGWIRVITDRYGDCIQVYEAVNEMHDWPFANPMRYGHEQLLEITASVCQWLGEMAPGKTRIINHCCPWGEYSQEYQADNWVPLTYLQEVIDHGIEFEGIGVQFYTPGRDMMEIASHIDRFTRFDRLLFITETAVPSAPSHRAAVGTGQIHSSSLNAWRGPWTEDIQADWVEMFCTIAMARECVRGITYWDADDDRAFIRNAGLLDSLGNPKPSFHRLMMLKEKYLRKLP